MTDIGSMTRLFRQTAGPVEVESIWWFGCHRCQELPEIRSLFPHLKRMTLVDPLADPPKVISGLDVVVITKAITTKQIGKTGTGKFQVTANDGKSSSLRNMSEECIRIFPWAHPAGYREVGLLSMDRLGDPPDALLMDIQGSEFDILKDGLDIVKVIGFIYSEVCYVSLYDGQGLYDDIAALLAPHFNLVGKLDEHPTYGNALWQGRGA